MGLPGPIRLCWKFGVPCLGVLKTRALAIFGVYIRAPNFFKLPFLGDSRLIGTIRDYWGLLGLSFGHEPYPLPSPVQGGLGLLAGLELI